MPVLTHRLETPTDRRGNAAKQQRKCAKPHNSVTVHKTLARVKSFFMFFDADSADLRRRLA
ncbi:MAG: hypothetical protein ACRCUY_03960 [Thermoguttaceae bacterium]